MQKSKQEFVFYAKSTKGVFSWEYIYYPIKSNSSTDWHWTSCVASLR